MSPQFQWDSYYGRDLLRYRSAEIDKQEVINMLLAEYALRNLQQREEALNHRAIALQKAKAIESDSPELERANEFLTRPESKSKKGVRPIPSSVYDAVLPPKRLSVVKRK
jgi:hypothetical protein